MTDVDRIEQRLAAVERVVVDGDDSLEDLADLATLASTVESLEDRLDELDRRIAEVEGTADALGGFVGRVRSVNETVERQANSAFATVDRLERRLDDVERRLTLESGRDETVERTDVDDGLFDSVDENDFGDETAGVDDFGDETAGVDDFGDGTGDVSGPTESIGGVSGFTDPIDDEVEFGEASNESITPDLNREESDAPERVVDAILASSEMRSTDDCEPPSSTDRDQTSSDCDTNEAEYVSGSNSTHRDESVAEWADRTPEPSARSADQQQVERCFEEDNRGSDNPPTTPKAADERSSGILRSLASRLP